MAANSTFEETGRCVSRDQRHVRKWPDCRPWVCNCGLFYSRAPMHLLQWSVFGWNFISNWKLFFRHKGLHLPDCVLHPGAHYYPWCEDLFCLFWFSPIFLHPIDAHSNMFYVHPFTPPSTCLFRQICLKNIVCGVCVYYTNASVL